MGADENTIGFTFGLQKKPRTLELSLGLSM
jgi:hypothetical protein